MNYDFPKITCLDDIRPAIEGRKEFKIMDRYADGEKYYVVDYMVNTPDTFPNPNDAPDAITANHWKLRRECRGLLFDGLTEKLIARRYHKFFNTNERDETDLDNLDFTTNWSLLDKLDGSMLSPFLLSRMDKVYWGTMMGKTDIADKASKHIDQSNYDYDGFAVRMIESGYTPIFEWVSPQNRIVIRYQRDACVLTGVRHMEYGTYMGYSDMIEAAAHYQIPVVNRYNPDDIVEFLDKSKNETDTEGYVVRWSDGHMAKTKNNWYLRIHKNKELIAFEKYVVQYVLDNLLDDIIGELPEEDKIRVRKFENDLLESIRSIAGDIQDYVDKAHPWVEQSDDPKKEFSNNYVKTYKEPRLAAILYSTYRGEDPYEGLIKYVRKHAQSGSRLDSIRDIFGFNWNKD